MTSEIPFCLGPSSISSTTPETTFDSHDGINCDSQFISFVAEYLALCVTVRHDKTPQIRDDGKSLPYPLSTRLPGFLGLNAYSTRPHLLCHSNYVPSTKALLEMCDRIYKSLCHVLWFFNINQLLTQSSLMFSFFLYDKATHCPNQTLRIVPNESNIVPFFTLCYILARKYLDDFRFPTKSVCACLHLTTTMIFQTERAVLQAIDYDFNVTDEQNHKINEHFYKMTSLETCFRGTKL